MKCLAILEWCLLKETNLKRMCNLYHSKLKFSAYFRH